MAKPLLLVACLASIFILVSCTGRQKPSYKHSRKTCRYMNEVWSKCPATVCRPKTCDDVGYPVACPDLNPGGKCPVASGCICKEGYVRNFGDICVPMTHCPSCGGDSNAVSGCGNHYNNICSNYSSNPAKCETDCLYNGCDCKLGFVFDEITKKCVLPCDCSYMTCKKNEVYDPCPAPCPYRTCGINDAAVSCVPALDPGNHNCAPPKCRCKDGYYRNDRGKCVLFENCPVCTGLNEIYDPCPPPCPPQRCDVNIALILCAVPPQLGDPECKPGCRCIDNYVRNASGICIPRDDCPKCPNPNEEYDLCIAPCPPRRCDVDDRLIKCAAPPKVGDPLCEAGCRCSDGYYRNSLGVCVTREQCPPICKGAHEVYSSCIQGQCSPKKCSQVGFPVPCPRIDPKYCIEGCLCEEGYVKDENNRCILKTECPSCGGDSNAIAGCGNCNKRCSDIGKGPVSCIEICYENACDCKHGLYYDDNTKKCVPAKQCTPTCGPDEVYDECIQGHCNPKNCSQLGFPVPCPKIDAKYCIKGCLCKPGYLRNNKGVCIPIEKCPSCGGDPNAESGCGNHCGNQCSDYNKKNLKCPIGCQLNGCKCRKGYVHDPNTKKCVLPKYCTPVCKKDEVYSDCINNPCPVQNCSLIGVTVLCVDVDPKDCIKGCLCKPPLMKEDDGSCVPIADCKPVSCNKPNEYFEPCDYGCPPQTCESLERAYVCPIREGDTCKARCKCKQGYFRNKLEECITEAQCRQCMGPHEYYSCGGACDNVCATLNKQNQTSCPIVNIECNKMCYCEKDYARAKNGTCIPMKQCKEPQCGVYERYETCPARLCGPQKCSELGYPKPCPYLEEDCECPVKPACVCVDGYVRDSNGRCIPKKDCPKCGGDPNAQSGCGINCGKKCEDLGKEPGACITLCKENACDCKDGYYNDKKQKKCVLPSECTNICNGKNEIYENCTNPTCRPKKCSEVGFPLNCTDPPACNKGCVCGVGYVRNDKTGVCIPISQCPSCGGDPNARSGCGINCGKYCEDIGQEPGACIALCKENACDCKKEYYYDQKLGKCVLPSQCPNICNGEHEVYENCTNPTYNPKKCSEVGFPVDYENPPKCSKGCICELGYVRNDTSGKCIPIAQCPSCGGDPNARSGCGINCGKNCEDIGKGPVACILLCKVNACDCKDKYYYDKRQDRCVLPSQCTKVCPGKHEVYESCTNPSCRPKKCSEVGFSLECTNPPACTKGCVCEEGYVRNDTSGICIPMKQCPSCGGDKNAESGCGVNCLKKCYDLQNPSRPRPCPKICNVNSCDCKKGFYYDENTKNCVCAEECTPACGKDEVYNSCVNGGCGRWNCSQLNQPILCIDPLKCEAGCSCKRGYLREDDTGICVPEEKCPNVCNKPNEEYVKCPPTCPPQTCNALIRPFPCPLIKVKINESDCLGECRCKEGYYRNSKEECISEEDCLKCKGAYEYFSCGPACDNVCCDLDTQSKDNCPIKNIKCVPRCYCEDGYARNQDGVCIPIEQCPGRGSTEPIPT